MGAELDFEELADSDAVANERTAAIDDQGERIEALNERLVRLSASSTATVTSNDGVTTPAVGGERREDARATSRSKNVDDHSRSASPSGRGERSKPESKALTRLGYGEIEQDGEDYAADLPKLGRVGDPADEKAGGANLSAGRGEF